MDAYKRPQAATLAQRLSEPRRFLQVVAGPRQVGKTTLVQQVLETRKESSFFQSADEPTLQDPSWIRTHWETARIQAKTRGTILVLDEIQKIPGWAGTVKHLWDEDTRCRVPLKLIVLGSAPLLVTRGLSESLAGRFELLHLPHWGPLEMRMAFGWSIDTAIFFGGYPGSAPLVKDEARWSRYIRDAMIETTLSRDLFLLSRIDKPALLRRLFELGCHYSGQILSYTKMLGQLADAGNTTTLAHYLDLLTGAGMMTGLQKYSGEAVRVRNSSPKLQVLNTALTGAYSGKKFAEAKKDRAFWGRLVESAVGAQLANLAASGLCKLYYWRQGDYEVDFVVQWGKTITAIKVKSFVADPSQRNPIRLSGMAAFSKQHPKARCLLVGGDGVTVEDFLIQPPETFLSGS